MKREYPKTVEEALEAGRAKVADAGARDVVPTNEFLVDLAERLLRLEMLIARLNHPSAGEGTILFTEEDSTHRPAPRPDHMNMNPGITGRKL